MQKSLEEVSQEDLREPAELERDVRHKSEDVCEGEKLLQRASQAAAPSIDAVPHAPGMELDFE
eukprot:6407126-Pyramimonas_sp.AAC.1